MYEAAYNGAILIMMLAYVYYVAREKAEMKMKMMDSKSTFTELPNMNANASSTEDTVNHISMMFMSKIAMAMKSRTTWNAVKTILSSVARTLVALSNDRARSLRFS